MVITRVIILKRILCMCILLNVTYTHILLFCSMKAGSRDHLNGSSEALAEEDCSSPNDVCYSNVYVFTVLPSQIKITG